MHKVIFRLSSTVGAGLLALAGCTAMQTGQQEAREATPGSMTFFVTSAGPGRGADLGGLEGADRHCQSLAQAAGAGHRSWRAYLSTQGSSLSDPKFVNARDRIGSGPWHNAKGVRIARNVEDLHAASNNLNVQTALDERGRPIRDRTQKPNEHDILTGSRPDGTAFPGAPFPDMTCSNWTSSAAEGSAMVGHHDRAGPADASWARSWNSAHPSRGCSAEALRPTGGNGYFYCFAER